MAEVVSDPGHERRFRADHDQVDLVLAAEGEQPLAVLGMHGVAGTEPRDAGVPWRGMQLVAVLALSELPGKRVFAPARPHHENLHRAECFKGVAGAHPLGRG
jgi:hypothetical protein